jgi:hypothetical protein
VPTGGGDDFAFVEEEGDFADFAEDMGDFEIIEEEPKDKRPPPQQ